MPLLRLLALIARDSMEECPDCGQYKRSVEDKCPDCIE